MNVIFKLIVLTFAICLVSEVIFSQQKYYRSFDGKILDSLSYSKMKDEAIEKKAWYANKMKLAISKVQINYKASEEYRNKDSIVYTYFQEIALEAKEEEKKIAGMEEFYDKDLPAFRAKTLNNKVINISSLKGKPALLNFWFATCRPCIDEMPVLNNIKNKFKDSVNFIAITYEKKKIVKQFLKKHEYDFMQVVEAKNIIRSLKIKTFPINVFLNPEGKVVTIKQGIGYIINNDKMTIGDGKEFEDQLRQLL